MENFYDLYIFTKKIKKNDRTDSSIKHAGKIYRVHDFSPTKQKSIISRIIFRLWKKIAIVDVFSGWILPTIVKLYFIIKRKKIKKVLISGPPFSAFIIALILKKLLKIDYYLDYRDPWFLYSMNNNWISRKSLLHLEKLIIKHSKCIILNTKEAYNEYKNLLINENVSLNFYVIANGFENTELIENEKKYYNKINIMYTGSIYGGRSLLILFKSINRLIKRNIYSRQDFSIHYFGDILPNEYSEILKMDLMKMLVIHDEINYKSLINFLKHADILYLIQGNVHKYSIPFKFYDYLSVRKPILAISCKDSSVEKIMDCGEFGEFADINDDNSVDVALTKILTNRNNYSFRGTDKFLWHRISKKLHQIIDSS